jgi:hypothetical protein
MWGKAIRDKFAFCAAGEYGAKENLRFSFKFEIFIQTGKLQWPTHNLLWSSNSLSFSSAPYKLDMGPWVPYGPY